MDEVGLVGVSVVLGQGLDCFLLLLLPNQALA